MSRSPAPHAPSSRAAAAPKPRAPRLGFESVPRRWVAGSTAATHVANGVNLLFPAGERFFVRSVRHYADRIQDPVLAAQIRGFYGQEGRHAQAHERFFDTLRSHGYDVDAIVRDYERLAFGRIDRLSPPALRLAITVALEHFTAIMAEDALLADGLAFSDPAMRRLLEWHAVEELEHKSVAFDVLKAVHPSYALRLAGLFVAAVGLGSFWVWATRRFLAEDGLTLRDAARELARLRAEAPVETGPQPIFRRVFLKGIRSYLRPGFHPDDVDHKELVEATLARLTREGVIPDESPVAQAAE